MSLALADVLGKHLQRSHTSVNRLALLSGIPQRTIANWLNGQVQKPHQWQPLIHVALALHLTELETNELLKAARHPALDELRLHATAEADRALLARFHTPALLDPLPPPFQVIANTPTFVGRSAEIAELERALLDGGRATVLGLHGMGGVGKTTLAAHLAYQLRARFPDGVLWARLDASDTLSILGAFAEAYGRDVSQYNDVESRSSVVRNLLADKRVLIVLDNAETSMQVRPLLPPSIGSSAVLVTTRHDLSVLDGWKQLILGPLGQDAAEALQLFEHYLGGDFVRLHSAELSEIAGLVGNLPLALVIVAGRLANNLHSSAEKRDKDAAILAALLDSLRTSHARLNLLTRDDLRVRASFDVSYEALSPFQKEFFSALGIFDGRDFTPKAAAFLFDLPLQKAEEELKKLKALCLIQENPFKRWHLHPLLRDYAREQMEQNSQLIPIVEKTLLMYRQAASEQWSFPQSLDEEITNIRYALDQASRVGLHKPLLETVDAIYPILFVGAWFSLTRTALEQAREAARALGDMETDLKLVIRLSRAQLGLGDHASIRENLLSALQLARSMNSAEDVFDILTTLGKLEHDTGHRKQANAYLEEGLAAARQLDDPLLLSRSLNGLAANRMTEARFKESKEMMLEALEIIHTRERGEAPHRVLMNLGELSLQVGDWDEAHAYFQEALPLAQAGRYRAAVVATLATLAKIDAYRGEWARAERSCKEAIQLAVEINSPRVEGIARGELGQILRQRGKFNEALEQLERGREASLKAGDRERECIILHYLGMLYLDWGKITEAYNALGASLSIAREIDHKILIADICFVQAVALFTGGRAKEAGKMAGEGLTIYNDLGLSRQAGELKKWMKDRAISVRKL